MSWMSGAWRIVTGAHPAALDRYFEVVQDWPSFIKVRMVSRTSDSSWLRGRQLSLRLRALGGARFHCRWSSSDLDTIWDTFYRKFHLPPPGISEVRTILDLGAHIGSTAAHLATLFPSAEVLAVEPNPKNLELARQNLEIFGDRCRLLPGAVARESGTARLECDEWLPCSGRAGQRNRTLETKAHSMQALIDQMGGTADFVKMNVVGSEGELFTTPDAVSWIRRVRSFNISTYRPENAALCTNVLQNSGFRCTQGGSPRSILAVRL